MRQENFLISLFNKELLDLRVPRPNGWPTEEGKGRTLTRSLEWNLQFCLMEYLFDRRGQVRKVFLKSKNRAALIDGYVECNGFLTFPSLRACLGLDGVLSLWVS
jgi:autophagy-related protein 9